jgi:hypothetical protein
LIPVINSYRYSIPPSWSLNTVFDETASSHSSDNTVVGGWRASDASDFYYDGTNDYLYWNHSRGTNDAMSYDLGFTVDDTAWVFRMGIEWTAFNSNAYNEQRMGLSNQDSTVAHTGSHDFLGMLVLHWSPAGYNITGSKSDDASIGFDTAFTYDWSSDVSVDTQVYLEVIRLSSTTYSIGVSNGNEYDRDITDMGNFTVASTIDGMSKIWLGNENAGSGSSGNVSKTREMKFADGVTTPP